MYAVFKNFVIFPCINNLFCFFNAFLCFWFPLFLRFCFKVYYRNTIRTFSCFFVSFSWFDCKRFTFLDRIITIKLNCIFFKLFYKFTDRFLVFTFVLIFFGKFNKLFLSVFFYILYVFIYFFNFRIDYFFWIFTLEIKF